MWKQCLKKKKLVLLKEVEWDGSGMEGMGWKRKIEGEEENGK